MDIRDIEAGKSYACKFRTSTFIDDNGKPIEVNLKLGQAHPGKPGVYEGLGIIEIRDLEKELVQLWDNESQMRFTVSYNDLWDVDAVEWTDG